MNIIDLLAYAYDMGYHNSWGLPPADLDPDNQALLEAGRARWEELRQEKASAWDLLADAQECRLEVSYVSCWNC